MAFALRLPDADPGPSAEQVAAAVRTELATELARLDVALTTRAGAGDLASVRADLDALLVRITSARAALLDNLDAPVSSVISALADAVRIDIS